MEIIDIYNENKEKTGKTIVRKIGVKLEKGEYLLGTQIIIINSQKEILITQRAPSKKIAPLKWECNGGGVRSGEDSKIALKREVSEELGIDIDINKLIFLKTANDGRRFKDIYVYKLDINIENIKFEDNEAIDARWVNIETYNKMFEKEEIVQNNDFDEKDYKKASKLLNL